LDQEVIDEVEAELGGRADRRLRGPDDLHDLLLRAGDQSPAEIDRWFDSGDARSARSDLERHGRAIEISIAGERRWIAAEDAARYRDALGVQVPPDLPERFLQQIADPLGDILMKYARGCGPFSSAEPAARYGLGTSIVEQTLERLAIAGRLVEGEFRPEGTRREWCERDLLRRIRRRTLARLRHEIEPAEPADYARFLGQWQRVGSRGRGLDALLDVIEILQGFPIPVSILESDILASRLARYSPSDLDTLMAAGEVTWRGLEPVGKSDGRIALFLADSADLLMPARVGTDLASGIENEILLALGQKGALFFSEILDALGGGFPGDVLEAIWSLVWKGRLTNDSVAPLRSMADSGRKSGRAVRFRSRRSSPPTAEGRWRALAPVSNSPTESALATTTQLLTRYGVLTRELLDAERVNGGFASVSPLLRAMEESGRIRRGFFVAGAGAMQFARPEAIERLRENRRSALVTAVTIAASDPSNPYGRVFPWPWDPSGPSPHRGAGAHVVMVEGHPAAWLPAGEETLLINLPESEPERNPQGRAVADQLAGFVERGRRRALLIREIDGVAAGNHPFAPFLLERGFRSTPMGLQLRTGANQTEE
ncbi:MAG TPA: DEAD/DEAH box helicase, partial [Thermoanaerobaculia bacterium]|nr:DEAD/DEAH box helicase [Thermoanaerobaculia bacterium]